MRYDAEHKARTRERVLKEAVKAIRASGPGRLGVAGVMQSAGLTHGGFYAHFESKDDLVMAAVAEMFGGAHGAFERRTEGLQPRDALRDYVRFYLSRAHRDARDGGCPRRCWPATCPAWPNRPGPATPKGSHASPG